MAERILTNVHAFGGFLSLAAAAVAIVARIAPVGHRLHVIAGRLFVVSMLAVCMSALILAAFSGNVVLLLLAVFSGYLTLAGWSFARNRRGEMTWADRLRATAMIIAVSAMIIYGIATIVRTRSSFGVVMLAFGGIAGSLAWGELQMIGTGGIKGPERIRRHLTMMLAATNAAVTAFVVVNFTFRPPFVLWLAPTAIVVPVIVVWSRKYAIPSDSTSGS